MKNALYSCPARALLHALGQVFTSTALFLIGALWATLHEFGSLDYFRTTLLLLIVIIPSTLTFGLAHFFFVERKNGVPGQFQSPILDKVVSVLPLFSASIFLLFALPSWGIIPPLVVLAYAAFTSFWCKVMTDGSLLSSIPAGAQRAMRFSLMLPTLMLYVLQTMLGTVVPLLFRGYTLAVVCPVFLFAYVCLFYVSRGQVTRIFAKYHITALLTLIPLLITACAIVYLFFPALPDFWQLPLKALSLSLLVSLFIGAIEGYMRIWVHSDGQIKRRNYKSYLNTLNIVVDLFGFIVFITFPFQRFSFLYLVAAAVGCRLVRWYFKMRRPYIALARLVFTSSVLLLLAIEFMELIPSNLFSEYSGYISLLFAVVNVFVIPRNHHFKELPGIFTHVKRVIRKNGLAGLSSLTYDHKLVRVALYMVAGISLCFFAQATPTHDRASLGILGVTLGMIIESV